MDGAGERPWHGAAVEEWGAHLEPGPCNHGPEVKSERLNIALRL